MKAKKHKPVSRSITIDPALLEVCDEVLSNRSEAARKGLLTACVRAIKTLRKTDERKADRLLKKIAHLTQPSKK